MAARRARDELICKISPPREEPATGCFANATSMVVDRTGGDGVARLSRQTRNLPALRGNGLLHLHGLQDQNEVTLGHGIAVRDSHLHDGAPEWVGQLVAAGLQRRAGGAGLGFFEAGLAGLAAPPISGRGTSICLAVDLNHYGGASSIGNPRYRVKRRTKTERTKVSTLVTVGV